jgi:hypothetical protein
VDWVLDSLALTSSKLVVSVHVATLTLRAAAGAGEEFMGAGCIEDTVTMFLRTQLQVCHCHLAPSQHLVYMYSCGMQ